MICIIDWKDKSPKHKKVFVSKCRIWKLKDADKREEYKTKDALERVIENRVRGSIDLSDMQFGFRPGRGTMDAIFIVRQMQEKYLAKQKELWMAFVDLEKAFDRVPRRWFGGP